MNLGRLVHLSYSTLVHSGDDWDLMEHSLRSLRAEGESRVSPTNQSFGLSLRLAPLSAEARSRTGPCKG